MFDSNGRYETQWKNLHRPCGLYMPYGHQPICYIGEVGPAAAVSRDIPNLGPRVSIVDHEGKLIGRFGNTPAGTELGKFLAPHGLAVDAHGDIYVGEVSWTAWPQIYPGKPHPMIEAKYANAVPVRNCLHLIVASNDDWVVPAGTDERRFFVLDVSPIKKSNFPYFESINEELKNGGSAAMLHELLQRDISCFNVRFVPDTVGLSDQKIRSLRGFAAWWYETLQEGKIAGVASNDSPFSVVQDHWTETTKVNKDTLYLDYVDFSKERKEYRPEEKSQLGKFLRRYVPGLAEERPRQPGTTHRDRLYLLPPLRECRAEFEKVIGRVEWEDT